MEIGTGTRTNRRTRSAYYPQDTAIAEMKRWQERTRVQLRAVLDADAELATPPTGPETFEQAADAYLATVTAMPSYESRSADLLAWRRALRHLALADLTANALRLVWNAWRADGRAVSTLNHRRTAIVACLAQQSPALATLARETLAYTADPLPVPRELPYALIQQILDALPESVSSAMLRVMAETGQPPATIRRLQPHDVDERKARLVLGVRQKGGKVAGVIVPITPKGAAALALFRRLNAWGGVSRQTLCIVWERGCAAARKAGADVPPCTPYILRHSFAGRVLDATGGDIQALMQLMQHRDLETTMRYARARAQRAASQAIEKMIQTIDPDHARIAK